LHPPRVCGCVCEGIVLSCAIGLMCYRVGALSGLCAIYFVCYRDVGYRVGALSGWCAIALCANGTRSVSVRWGGNDVEDDHRLPPVYPSQGRGGICGGQVRAYCCDKHLSTPEAGPHPVPEKAGRHRGLCQRTLPGSGHCRGGLQCEVSHLGIPRRDNRGGVLENWAAGLNLCC